MDPGNKRVDTLNNTINGQRISKPSQPFFKFWDFLVYPLLDPTLPRYSPKSPVFARCPFSQFLGFEGRELILEVIYFGDKGCYLRLSQRSLHFYNSILKLMILLYVTKIPKSWSWIKRDPHPRHQRNPSWPWQQLHKLVYPHSSEVITNVLMHPNSLNPDWKGSLNLAWISLPITSLYACFPGLLFALWYQSLSTQLHNTSWCSIPSKRCTLAKANLFHRYCWRIRIFIFELLSHRFRKVPKS